MEIPPHYKNLIKKQKSMREILMDSDVVVEMRLQNRQGIVCNNILHGRQAFSDDESGSARLIYRARYYDSIDFASTRPGAD